MLQRRPNAAKKKKKSIKNSLEIIRVKRNNCVWKADKESGMIDYSRMSKRGEGEGNIVQKGGKFVEKESFESYVWSNCLRLEWIYLSKKNMYLNIKFTGT